MRKLIALGLLAGVIAMGAPAEASAQDSGLLAVGAMAPDFALPGATRYGLLQELSLIHILTLPTILRV